MIKKHYYLCIALTGVLTATSTHALAKTYTLKPGLWQIESQTWLHGHLVPDMNALIGLGPVALQNHVQNTLRKLQLHNKVGCSVANGQRTGNNIHFDIRCDAPKGNGYTDVTVVNASKWVSYSKLDLTIRKTNQNITNQSFGTWINEHCPL